MAKITHFPIHKKKPEPVSRMLTPQEIKELREDTKKKLAWLDKHYNEKRKKTL